MRKREKERITKGRKRRKKKSNMQYKFYFIKEKKTKIIVF